jgi:hypothetical protein
MGYKTHELADCMECDFYEDELFHALRLGREHNRKTGHEVRAETGTCYVYNKSLHVHPESEVQDAKK